MVTLAEALIMDRTTMARNLQPLAREGLVNVQSSDMDRRLRVVSLTADGMKKVFDGTKAWQYAQQTFESKFGYEKALMMREMMGSVIGTDMD